MSKIYLSVVITSHNEEANLKAGVLDNLNAYLLKQPYSWEVIINDDGSTDNSWSILSGYVKHHPHFRLLKGQHGGKARGLLNGVQHSSGQIILTTDMDQSTPISEIEKLLPWLKKGYNIVIGSRGLVRENFTLFRKLATVIFRYLRGIFLLHEIQDTQCGFKLYKAAVLKNVFPRLLIFSKTEQVQGWRVSAFDVELLFLAKKFGHRIKEVVVDWRHEDLSTTKSRKFIKESKNMALEIWRVKLNDWQGKYDALVKS